MSVEVLPKGAYRRATSFQVTRPYYLAGGLEASFFHIEVLVITDPPPQHQPIVIYLWRETGGREQHFFAEFESIPEAVAAAKGYIPFETPDKKVMEDWGKAAGFISAEDCKREEPWFYTPDPKQIREEMPAFMITLEVSEVQDYLRLHCPRTSEGCDKTHEMIRIPNREDMYLAHCGGFNNRVVLVYKQRGKVCHLPIAGKTSTIIAPGRSTVRCDGRTLCFTCNSVRSRRGPSSEFRIIFGGLGEASPEIKEGDTGLF